MGEGNLPVRTIIAALALEMDGDPVAARALQLARRHEARLVFVHVIEDGALHDPAFPAPRGDAGALLRTLEQDAAARLREMAGDDLSRAVEIVVAAGKPFEIITEIAKREAADLVVIGPGTARNIREKVFGSTADRVVRSASGPILVVRSPADQAYARVAVALDFSASSIAAAQAAIRLAPDAATELVHVVEIPLAFEQAMRKAGTPQAEIDRYRKAKAREARKEMRAAVADTDLAQARLRVVHGAAGDALLRLARRGKTDLIALGTQGRTAIAQALLGSVARRVLQAASCDVLVNSG